MDSKEILNFANFVTRHQPRAYVNTAVRFHHLFTEEDRYTAAIKAGWNVFQFPSEMLLGGDLLSDSGTTTLTSEQISAMFLGDESYGSNYGYFELIKSFEKTFGISSDQSEIYLFHQGRAAEHALFTQVGKWGKNLIIPSNGHFDTTRANIESVGMEAIDFFTPVLGERREGPFNGNMDIAAFETFLKENSKRVPMVFLTITNNTGGGQPVSLKNIQIVRKLCDQYQKPLFLDACRFAENSWFIKNRETKYKNSSILEIIHEVFSLCDGFTISLKKDGLSNMGGALVLRRGTPLLQEHPDLLHALHDYQILVEGHPTYGGLSGHDIMVIAAGLDTVVQESYLNSRIGQVQAFGDYFKERDIPVITPFGGHAIYFDMNRFFADTKSKPEDFGGIAFTALLLLKGVRLCELGNFAFGKFDSKTGKEIFPKNNFVRAAIPRNKYELADLYYVGDCITELYKKRHQIPRAIPIYGRELSLRHFKARFELKMQTD